MKGPTATKPMIRKLEHPASAVVSFSGSTPNFPQEDAGTLWQVDSERDDRFAKLQSRSPQQPIQKIQGHEMIKLDWEMALLRVVQER